MFFNRAAAQVTDRNPRFNECRRSPLRAVATGFKSLYNIELYTLYMLPCSFCKKHKIEHIEWEEKKQLHQ